MDFSVDFSIAAKKYSSFCVCFLPQDLCIYHFSCLVSFSMAVSGLNSYSFPRAQLDHFPKEADPVLPSDIASFAASLSIMNLSFTLLSQLALHLYINFLC